MNHFPTELSPNRCNIVVSKSRKELPNCEVYASLEEALTAVTNKTGRDKAEADKQEEIKQKEIIR